MKKRMIEIIILIVLILGLILLSRFTLRLILFNPSDETENISSLTNTSNNENVKENSSNEEESNLIWIYIKPTQCYDPNVPNEIYFNEPGEYSGFFPEYKNGTEYPINFNQTQNFIEYVLEEAGIYKEALKNSGKSEEEIENIANQIIEDEGYVLEEYNLTTKIVKVYDSKKDAPPEGTGTCASCSCPTGETLYLLINEKDFETFSQMGYEEVTE